MKNTNKFLNWDNYSIPSNNIIFSPDLLLQHLNTFWTEVVEKSISSDQHILFLFRLQWTDNQFATIGKLQKLNLEDKEFIYDFILQEMEDKSEYYKEQSIISFTFSYGIRNGRAKDKIITTNVQFQNYFHHKLPITMNPLEYGELIDQTGNKYWMQINDKNTAVITQHDNYNEVKLFRSGVLRYIYKDIIINENTFIREFDNKKFTFVNKELKLVTVEKLVKFIKSLKKETLLRDKFLTMDIETFIKNGVHIPYAISIYDGINIFSYYLTDFNNSEDMLITAIKSIMVKKYDNFKVYIHNFANFDAIFLLKILIKLGHCKPIIHNDKIISLQFNFNGYILHFRDSQQLLLSSLRSLGNSFNVEVLKSIFPYSFVSENNLNYVGNIPNIKLFDNVTKDDYNNYCKDFINQKWSLRDETIKYCNIDCISLYQIILKFNKLIFNLFNINIHKYPTISSLAFAVFRTNFLKEDTIPQLSGQIANDIRLSYTGGACDMYIPFNILDKDIYWTDANSLFPSVMMKQDMPIGKPTFFQGNIRKYNPDAFGFFFCNITAPKDLLHPILQTHVLTKAGMRTIAPLGQWTDMLFSDEMDNAIKLGYNIEILWGYTFKKENIFKEYVSTLYNIRLEYPKSNPLNLIAKILMNSLYGRFGMLDSFANISIFDNIELYQNFEDKFSDDIIDIVELDDQVLVKHKSSKQDINTLLDNASETHNTNIAVASAITAYSRIFMSQFKNNKNYNLYYSDTDSIFIDKPLDDSLMSNIEIGKMKLENICKKAIFLSPKVYCVLTKDNQLIYKVKGLSHNVNLTMSDFENLLFKNNKLVKNQTKWYKSVSKGNISVLDQLYTLQTTDNKRKLIYTKDSNSKLVFTTPYIINKDKQIINFDDI